MNYRKLTLCLLLAFLAHFPLMSQTAIIAHRGLWNVRGSAQNSIESLHRAYDTRGIYGLEIDVQLTKDSVLILSHDPDIGGYRIDKTDWSQLRDNVRLRSKEQIPTLDEFLEALSSYPDLKLFLELKTQEDPGSERYLADQALAMVKAHGLLERTAFISFSIEICKQLVKSSPESLVMHLRADYSPKELYAMGMRGVDYNYSVFWKHPEWFDEARSLGMSIGAWTVNEPATMQYFIIPRGFDFMTTDNVMPAMDVFDLLKIVPRDISKPII